MPARPITGDKVRYAVIGAGWISQAAFMPGVAQTKNSVIEQSGVLGRVWLFTSTFTQAVAASNHRANHGFWAGPVSDMGPYPVNAVRNLFRAEPIEVMARGVRHPHLGYNFDDTVSVTLRFPGDRIAQFTVAYGPNSVNEYRICGDKGDLLV